MHFFNIYFSLTRSLAFLLRFRKRKKKGYWLFDWMRTVGLFLFTSTYIKHIWVSSKRVWFFGRPIGIPLPILIQNFLSLARNHVFKACNVDVRCLPMLITPNPFRQWSSSDERRNFPLLLFVNDNEVIKVYLIVKTVQRVTECRHIFRASHSDEMGLKQ